MKKAKWGYCAVTADFLHIGHINYINFCKDKCQKLIVGIMSDQCVTAYKGREPVMNEQERSLLIQSLKNVNSVILQHSFEFPHSILRMKWHWEKDFIIFDSEEHKRENADIIVPRTKEISSSMVKRVIKNENSNNSKRTL